MRGHYRSTSSFITSCLQPLAGGLHHYFLFLAMLGCRQSEYARFWCVRVQSQGWSIFGWVPEFTSYHFNHYPQRKGQGVKCPKKILKNLLPMFQQSCLVFTGRGSCCRGERKKVAAYFSNRGGISFLYATVCSLYILQSETLHWGEKGRSGRPAGGFSWIGPSCHVAGPTTSCPALSHNSWTTRSESIWTTRP